MQKTLIINRYQLTQHMQAIPEANYYSAIDMASNNPVTVRAIDISSIGAAGIGLEHLAADKLRLKMENEKSYPSVVPKRYSLWVPRMLIGIARLLPR